MTNLPLKVLCINDKSKPSQIPIESWVEEGEPYTVIDIIFFDDDTNFGIILAELPLGEECFPHRYFGHERFTFLDDGYEKFLVELDNILKDESRINKHGVL